MYLFKVLWGFSLGKGILLPDPDGNESKCFEDLDIWDNGCKFGGFGLGP